MRGFEVQRVWNQTQGVVVITTLLFGSMGLAQTVVPTDDPALQIRAYDVIELLNGRKL